jgi:hypothetical protein
MKSMPPLTTASTLVAGLIFFGFLISHTGLVQKSIAPKPQATATPPPSYQAFYDVLDKVCRSHNHGDQDISAAYYFHPVHGDTDQAQSQCYRTIKFKGSSGKSQSYMEDTGQRYDISGISDIAPPK